MKAEETTVARLVRGEMQFQVPIYQRTYRWTTNDHLAQLWNDITDQADLIATGDASESRATHFLGSVVLAPVPANDATCPRWLVVDGQQRLTSLSTALAAYRDHRATEDPRIKDRIDDQYLINKYREGDLYLRLLPTLADRASYNAAIRGTDEMCNDAIGAAYDFFLKKLRSVDDRDHLDRIEQAITTRLSLVVITADKDDNVHRIFESLNNRGLKLSQADLLRNFLFMRLPNRSEHVYTTQWLPMQNSLENEDLERLMWLQLVLDGEDRVRQQDMYAAQQRRLDGGEAQVEAYVTELRRRSRHLIRIIDPDEEPNHRVRDYLKRLLRWQGAVTHPAVMLLLDRQEKGLIDDAELVQALAVIESFLVRRLICQIPTNNFNRIFQSLPSQLPADKGTLEGLRWVLSGERHFWPSDAELRDAIRTKQFYLRGTWDQKYLILQRLEESFGHSEPVDFERAQLTIEHVLPQEPGSDWLEVLAEEAGSDETPEELHIRIVHTLGNLTLTADNSRLSNHLFQRKQDLLKGSHLEMNKRIAATERWGAAEIKARADELADQAIKLWTAPDAGGHQVRQYRDWSPLKQALAAMPYGTWTTYGDLAALLGSSAQAVGTYLTTTVGVVNAHRVLNVYGRVAEGFRWPDGSDRDIFEVLAADGVKFDGRRVADKEQRLSVDDLVALAGLMTARRHGARRRQP